MTAGWDAAAYDSRFSFVTSLGAPLLDLLDASAGDRVLDLGCGTGHQAAELAVRMIERYERPTPLTAGDTAAGWVRMFGPALLDDVPEMRRAEFDAAVDAHAAAAGLRGPGDAWTADYVRVRFIAVAA